MPSPFSQTLKFYRTHKPTALTTPAQEEVLGRELLLEVLDEKVVMVEKLDDRDDELLEEAVTVM